jgi:hypothetical protein
VDECDEKRTRRGACECAPREPLDTHACPEQEAAGDDRRVVDQRRRGLCAEAAVCHERAAQDPAGDEEDLRGEHDARESHRERLDLGIEAPELEHHEGLRPDPERGGERHREEAERAEDGREETLRRGLPSALPQARVHGDEGDREGAAGEQVIQEIGKLEGGAVGVHLRAHAHLAREHHLAHVADHAREEHAASQQRGGGGEPAPVRRLRCVLAHTNPPALIRRG